MTKRRHYVIPAIVLLLGAGPATLSPVERKAAFKAASAVMKQGKWMLCADQPDNQGARIDEVRDLNGDGRPEAMIAENGSFCYGAAGMGYALVSKQADGRWKLMTSGGGMPDILKTRGAGGWPDIRIGGPGFCFPVERWNGKAYVLQRHEYEGRRCKP